MHTQLKKLFLILSPKQKRRFYILSLLMTITGFLEIITVISLLDFISFLGNGSDKNNFQIISNFYEIIKYNKILNIKDLSIFVIIIILITVISNLFNIVLTVKFSSKTGGELENKLFNYYLKRDYIFHLDSNTSKLLNNVFQLIPRVSNFVLAPLMLIFSKIIFLIPILISLCIFKPEIALLTSVVFIIFYFMFYKIFKSKLTDIGAELNLITEDKFKILQEGFGAIKEVKLFNKFNLFSQNYFNLYNRLVKLAVVKEAIGRFPRYFIEAITFVITIILITYLHDNLNLTFENLIVHISFFLICAYKIIPAFQQIYYNLTHIKNHFPALDEVYSDLLNLKLLENKKNIINRDFFGNEFEKLELKKLSYSYEKRKNIVLEDINLEIKKGEKIAITGLSGAGKSTLIHILLGLINQNKGKIYINNEELNNTNYTSWQKFIGYVPQSIYLLDKSIDENIAFGLTKKEINYSNIEYLLSITKLSNFVKTLPEKNSTKIGERGIQFSGGQQQRIGIARALYRNPDVIILDEATNSLDALTENEIIDSIIKFKKNITIIMITHKPEIIKKFDKIIYLDKGRLEGFAPFENLIKNINFKKMLNLDE